MLTRGVANIILHFYPWVLLFYMIIWMYYKFTNFNCRCRILFTFRQLPKNTYLKHLQTILLKFTL